MSSVGLRLGTELAKPASEANMGPVEYHPLLQKREIEDGIRYACEVTGCKELIPIVTIQWSNALKRSLGYARYNRKPIRNEDGSLAPEVRHIRLSTHLMRLCSKEEQLKVVVHETCHLVAWHRYKAGGHGVVWRNLMNQCGLKAEKYAKVNGPVWRKRAAHTNHTFMCGCRRDVKLGPAKSLAIAVRHAEIMCGICKKPFVVQVSMKELERRKEEKIRKIIESRNVG